MSVAILYHELILEPTLKYFGSNADFVLYVFGTQILHMITFWIHCSLLAIIDFNPSSFKSFSQWKMQPEKNCPLSFSKFLNCVQIVLVNQLVVNFIAAYFAFQYMKSRGGVSIHMDTFPTLTSFILEFIFFVIIEEIGFYYSHRLFHTPLLYKWIHKKHHDWIAPIGCACIYAHPIEHLCSNLLPLVAGL